MPEETSAQEEETKSLSYMQSTHQSYTTSQLAWTETAVTRKKLKEPTVAPYLYTTKFNTAQDLLFCGGAGKNEMRVYDWESGSIVANISNLPKPILCGA